MKLSVYDALNDPLFPCKCYTILPTNSLALVVVGLLQLHSESHCFNFTLFLYWLRTSPDKHGPDLRGTPEAMSCLCSPRRVLSSFLPVQKCFCHCSKSSIKTIHVAALLTQSRLPVPQLLSYLHVATSLLSFPRPSPNYKNWISIFLPLWPRETFNPPPFRYLRPTTGPKGVAVPIFSRCIYTYFLLLATNPCT